MILAVDSPAHFKLFGGQRLPSFGGKNT